MPSDPPLPKGAQYIDNETMPPLPKGAVLDGTDITSEPAQPMRVFEAGKPQTWGQQVEEDVQQGGNRTWLGRILGHMQGRGDKGFSGIGDSGAAEFVGSPALGGAKLVRGISELPTQPLNALGHIALGGLEASQIPATFMGGPTSEAAIEAIPSRKFASHLFGSIMKDAADVPVNLTNSGNQLLRVQELAQRGTSMPQAAGKLLRRVTEPGSSPLTYQEARDFASNISRTSADEAQRLSPAMKREMGQLRSLFHQDIGDAAGTVGRGEDYTRALKEYARGAKLDEATNNILGE